MHMSLHIRLKVIKKVWAIFTSFVNFDKTPRLSRDLN